LSVFDIINDMNTFSDPQKIIEKLDIFPGQQIADLGAGSGTYTLAIAEKIKGNNESRIFSVDIQKDLLERIDTEAKNRNLHAVHIIWGDIEQEKGTRLRHDSLDVVILANILFQVEHKKDTLKEAYRILKPEGRLIIIDWSESFGNIGPKSDHVVTKETAELLCIENGFKHERSFDAGEHHYGFISKKN